MTITDEYLLTAFLKCRKDLSVGFDSKLISQILILDDADAAQIEHILTNQKLIRQAHLPPTPLILTGVGIDDARTMIQHPNCVVIKFLS